MAVTAQVPCHACWKSLPLHQPLDSEAVQLGMWGHVCGGQLKGQTDFAEVFCRKPTGADNSIAAGASLLYCLDTTQLSESDYAHDTISVG